MGQNPYASSGYDNRGLRKIMIYYQIKQVVVPAGVWTKLSSANANRVSVVVCAEAALASACFLQGGDPNSVAPFLPASQVPMHGTLNATAGSSVAVGTIARCMDLYGYSVLGGTVTVLENLV